MPPLFRVGGSLELERRQIDENVVRREIDNIATGRRLASRLRERRAYGSRWGVAAAVTRWRRGWSRCARRAWCRAARMVPAGVSRLSSSRSLQADRSRWQ
jgi:hypothetical protein